VADGAAARAHGLACQPKPFSGEPLAGTFRAHQAPLSAVADDPAELALLDGRLPTAVTFRVVWHLTGRHGLLPCYEASLARHDVEVMTLQHKPALSPAYT
jgi:phosphoketolase